MRGSRWFLEGDKAECSDEWSSQNGTGQAVPANAFSVNGTVRGRQSRPRQLLPCDYCYALFVSAGPRSFSWTELPSCSSADGGGDGPITGGCRTAAPSTRLGLCCLLTQAPAKARAFTAGAHARRRSRGAIPCQQLAVVISMVVAQSCAALDISNVKNDIPLTWGRFNDIDGVYRRHIQCCAIQLVYP